MPSSELTPERRRARWWADTGGWEARWQLEHQSMKEDPTIAMLRWRQLRVLPDIASFVERLGVRLWDLIAYSALAETPGGRLRLIAVFPERPGTADPEVFCVDGPRQSLHRNPPFDNGIVGKSAILCLYYRKDPNERRWQPENGLLGLFDIARAHVTNEHVWRETGKWPGADAPHGRTAPARTDPSLAIAPLSPESPFFYRPPRAAA